MANRIRELREERNMTQIRLSIELEVTQETISAYEIGKHYPSIKSLMRMSELFNTSTDYILGLSDIRKAIDRATLSDQELKILTLYQGLGALQKEKALAYLQGLSES